MKSVCIVFRHLNLWIGPLIPCSRSYEKIAFVSNFCCRISIIDMAMFFSGHHAIIVSFLTFIFLPTLVLCIESLKPVQPVNYDCSRLTESCNNTSDCCLGTCVNTYCSDGLYSYTTRGLGDYDASEAISGELSTHSSPPIDVTNHPNIGQLPSLAECGYSSIVAAQKNGRSRRKRIVGGNAVEVGSYPWMVQINVHNISYGNAYFHCGGSILNNRTVLTAAHCITRISTAITLKEVTVGNIDRRQNFECDNDNTTCMNSSRYAIEETIVHELYTEGNVRNDIGIIRLKQEIVFNDFVRPICLPLTENIFKKFKDGKLTVIGWGTQNKALDNKPKVISWKEQEVENNLVARENCNRFFSRITGKLGYGQICAGGYPGKGDCQGDSGGPLFKKLSIEGEIPGKENETERFFQFGIVSTGAVVECGKQGKPSVYTSVINYMPWILDNIVARAKITICSNCTVTNKVKPSEELNTGNSVDVKAYNNVELLPKSPDCGNPPAILPTVVTGLTRVKRVVGGRPFGVGSFAWMAQVYVRNSITLELYLRCSGFIISSRYVMTAAHCVTEIESPLALDSIVIGNYNRLQTQECIEEECSEKKFIPIEDVIVHEYFAKYTHEYDIALIRLPEEIKFGRFLQPICLPFSEEDNNAWTNSKFSTAGWGKVSPEPDEGEPATSNILHAVNVTLQSRKACDFVYSRQTGVLDRSRLCGGGDGAGAGECAGDAGGPMMKWIWGPGPDGPKSNLRYYAFGIVSFDNCGQQGTPAIYSNILYHMPWVLRKIEA